MFQTCDCSLNSKLSWNLSHVHSFLWFTFTKKFLVGAGPNRGLQWQTLANVRWRRLTNAIRYQFQPFPRKNLDNRPKKHLTPYPYPIVMMTVGAPQTQQPFPSIWFCFQLLLVCCKTVDSGILFSQCFFCWPLLPPPCTVPCKIVLVLKPCWSWYMPKPHSLAFLYCGWYIIIGPNGLPDSVSDCIVGDVVKNACFHH